MTKKKSNKPTKTTKAMKTMKFFSIAALALVGAVMTGCSSDDELEPLTMNHEPNTVTLTTSVSLDGSNMTRSLSAAGVKTFAEGETMALVYKNTSGGTVKAVSAALTASDISGTNATFTFELTDPDKDQDVTYIYPAYMVTDAGAVNYDALANQNGTLTTLSSNLDLATKTSAWNDTSLPAVTLENHLALLALTLKNSDGTSDLTSTSLVSL